MNDIEAMKKQSDWVAEQALELKALFAYKSDKMIALNKNRALSDIDTMITALNEIKAYVEEMQGV